MAAGEKWYFSKEELANTPSRKSNFSADKELSYRQQAANFIQNMGQKLQVTQLCINTAIVYMHRFYMFHSFSHFAWNAMAAASLFLAAKVEEQPRKLEHVIRVAHICLHRDQTAFDFKSEPYVSQCQDLVFNENVLLQTLGFDVAIDHPHTHVVRCCHLVKASKELAQTSYFMASNSLHLTTMCLQYKPTVVACFCIYLACKWSNWEIPQSNEGKDWFYYVDQSVTPDVIEQLTLEFLQIFDKCPSRLRQKILSISASQSPNAVPPHSSNASSPFETEPRKIHSNDSKDGSGPSHARHYDTKSSMSHSSSSQDEQHKKLRPHDSAYREYREKKERERLEREKSIHYSKAGQSAPGQTKQHVPGSSSSATASSSSSSSSSQAAKPSSSHPHHRLPSGAEPKLKPAPQQQQHQQQQQAAHQARPSSASSSSREFPQTASSRDQIREILSKEAVRETSFAKRDYAKQPSAKLEEGSKAEQRPRAAAPSKAEPGRQKPPAYHGKPAEAGGKKTQQPLQRLKSPARPPLPEVKKEARNGSSSSSNINSAASHLELSPPAGLKRPSLFSPEPMTTPPKKLRDDATPPKVTPPLVPPPVSPFASPTLVTPAARPPQVKKAPPVPTVTTLQPPPKLPELAEPPAQPPQPAYAPQPISNGLETNPILISNLLKESAVAGDQAKAGGGGGGGGGVDLKLAADHHHHHHHKAEKKKKKHKHKEKNKEERKKKHKDKERHKGRPGTGGGDDDSTTNTTTSSTTSTTSPLKITIAMSKVHTQDQQPHQQHSQVQQAATVAQHLQQQQQLHQPAGMGGSQPPSGLKIKIPKDRLKTEAISEAGSMPLPASASAPAPAGGSLKIKISKEAIGGFSSSSSSDSKKRERDRSSPSAGGLPASKSAKLMVSSYGGGGGSKTQQNGRNAAAPLLPSYASKVSCYDPAPSAAPQAPALLNTLSHNSSGTSTTSTSSRFGSSNHINSNNSVEAAAANRYPQPHPHLPQQQQQFYFNPNFPPPTAVPPYMYHHHEPLYHQYYPAAAYFPPASEVYIQPQVLDAASLLPPPLPDGPPPHRPPPPPPE